MSDAGTAAMPVARRGLLRLVATKGASAGERFEAVPPGQPVTIGRKASNDFVLKDDTVSREHAVIEPTPDGWRIAPRRPGVFLMRAGQAVPDEGAPLADGDEIQLGLAVVQVTIEPVADEEDADRTMVFAPGAVPPPAMAAPPPPPPRPEPVPRRDVATEEAAPRLPAGPARPEPVPEPPATPVRAEPAAKARPAAPPPQRRRARDETPRERVGRFDVFTSLHDDDTCRVERAADARSGEAVTLRRLRSLQLGFFGRRRFLRAVDRLRTIAHPNLLAPREAGRAGDLFLVYPAVDGACASVVLREGRRDLPIDLAVWIGREVARGLAHAEQVAGPPLRLAVGDGDVVCRRDGGAMLLLAPWVPVPPAGDRHSAPEEHSGGAGDVRAAIFSLGVLLWELLAREPVLPGQQTTLRSVDAVRIQVPPALAAVVMRAVEARPEDRFSHAVDLADALEEELERLAPGYDAAAAARWLRDHVADEEGEPR